MRVFLSLLPPPGADDKAALDTEKLKEDVPKGLQKVELDLDDALFLDLEEEEEKKPAAAPEPPPPQVSPLPEVTKPPLWKRPLVLGVVGGVLLFILGVLTALLMLPSPKPAPTPPAPQEEKPKPAKPEKPITLHTIAFEPFFVEYHEQNATRFLTLRFSISGLPDILEWEVRRKKIILRDAVYYYLRNKGLTFLNDPANADKLKEDILAVMNQYLGNGQIETLLLDEYVIR